MTTEPHRTSLIRGAAFSQAGIITVRLHDLRHTFASQAVMNTETLSMVSRLLGRGWIGSAARYAHHDDAHVLDAVQTVGDLTAKRMKTVETSSIAIVT